MNAVVIDITRLLARYFDLRYPTGVDRVSLAYLSHYASVARTMTRWRGLSGIFSSVISKQVIEVLLRWDTTELQTLRLLIARGLLSSIGSGNAHGAVLLHTGHSDIEQESLWRSVRWHRVRPVFFVHDLIPVTHPQFCRDGEHARHKARMLRALKGAAVVANSEHTLLELLSFAQKQLTGIELPQHCVALLAPPAQYARELLKKRRIEVHKPYFLVVGTIEPRKNHALLLQVWKHMLHSLPIERVPKLVVIGQTGWSCADIEAQLSDFEQFQGQVQWIPQCEDADMARWMQGACALLFPSYVEGFGMPAVEALLAGTPVIASDLAVFRESVGSVPVYLPADNLQSWVDQIIQYTADDSTCRKAQLHRMQSWRAPTWDTHFAQVDALLVSLPAFN
jgi:glycosyltransferase involved in cell wall biosynthesis